MKKYLLLFIVVGIHLQLFADSGSSLNYEDQKKFDYFYLESLRLKYNNKHSEAFQALQHALEINPKSAAALFEISNYYTFLRQDSLALSALEQAVANKPDISEYKLALASQYRKTGKVGEAVALYEELLEDNPTNIELNFYLTDLYIQLQLYDKAIKSLNNMEDNTGMNESISLQKYNLYNEMGENEKGIAEIERLAAKYPFEARYQFMLGDIWMQQEKPEKAREYYEKGYQIEPLSPYYITSMVGYYKYKNEPDSINILFENLMEQHSQETELNRIYGLFLLSQKRLDEAKFQFQVVTEADPEDYDSWRQLLAINLTKDNFDDIIAVCDAALIHFSEEPDFYLYKGYALYQQGKYEESLDTFEKGIQIIPPNDRATLSTFYGQLGEIYHQLNDIEKAYAVYDKALDYNENNVAVLNNYAYFLSLDKKNLDRAERMSSKTVQIEPNNPTYLDTYAWIFFQKGNYNLAKFYIESAISNGGDKSSEVLEHYGDILYKTDNTDKAVQEWEKALQIQENESKRSLLEKKIKDRTYYEK